MAAAAHGWRQIQVHYQLMKYIHIYLFALALILSAGPVRSSETDFNKVCGYFELLETELKTSKLSITERFKFIDEKVKSELEPDSNARLSWEVVIYGEPDVRYRLYKTSVEEITKTDWHCEAMKKLIPTTGE